MLSFLLAITDESQHEKLKYIFENFHQTMLKYANNYLRRSSQNVKRSDVEDVVENALLRLTKYVHNIKSDATDKELCAYVLTIVVNECNRFLEKKKDIVSLDDSYLPSDDDFFEKLCIEERYQEVVCALKALPAIYSTALYLRFFEEKSVTEIATELDIPEKTVYTRIKRGREMLLLAIGKKPNKSTSPNLP